MGKYEAKHRTRRTAENPAQPPGWAVPDGDVDGPYREEGRQAEEELMAERARRLDQHVPTQPGGYGGENPAQPYGWAVQPPQAEAPPVVGKVYRPPGSAVVGSRVLLHDPASGETHRGHVAAVVDADHFAVQWADGRYTDDEEKTDYDPIDGYPPEEQL